MSGKVTLRPGREDFVRFVRFMERRRAPGKYWFFHHGVGGALVVLAVAPWAFSGLLPLPWLLALHALAAGAIVLGSRSMFLLMTRRAAARLVLETGPLDWHISWDDAGLTWQHLGGEKSVPWASVEELALVGDTLVIRLLPSATRGRGFPVPVNALPAETPRAWAAQVARRAEAFDGAGAPR